MILLQRNIRLSVVSASALLNFPTENQPFAEVKMEI